MRNCETQAHARHAVKFSEGSQDHQRVAIGCIRKAFGAARFDEGFVHDEQTAFAAYLSG